TTRLPSRTTQVREKRLSFFSARRFSQSFQYALFVALPAKRLSYTPPNVPGCAPIFLIGAY
ncbi:hypothetical protein, partial [Vibrio parahaemolyticus]|uniref:hypothetical protein n=1 Tax=Vibrio parahaemolyticus TaxID=670 RepID=UPI001A908387